MAAANRPAGEVLPQDDVDNATYGVRTIDGPPPVEQHFHPLYRRRGNVADVREQLLLPRDAGDAAPVDKHQRIAGTKPAQVRRADAEAERPQVRVQHIASEGEVVEAVDGGKVVRNGPDDLFGGGQALPSDVLGRDHDDPRGGIGGQARSGDDEDFEVLVLGLGLLLSGGLCGLWGLGPSWRREQRPSERGRDSGFAVFHGFPPKKRFATWRH